MYNIDYIMMTKANNELLIKISQETYLVESDPFPKVNVAVHKCLNEHNWLNDAHEYGMRY